MFFVSISLGLCAFIISYILFSPSIALAKTLGAIDFPSARKSHTTPTSRAGGLSFFVAFSLSLVLLPINASLKIPLVLSGGIIFIVGLIDDSKSISPFAKLSGQFMATSLYILMTHSEFDGFWEKLFGIASLFWIIFITNATNLCDGLDGLAGGITSSQALCLAIISLFAGRYDTFSCSILLLFSILGFLPRNIPPAQTFMGDCGSLFLGFILGTLSSFLVYKTQNLLVLISVLLIFRVSSADAIQSFIRRIVTGNNPFAADRGHFHHKLLDLGFTKECAVLALVTLSLIFGFIAILLQI